jgi:hypothetical protein
MSIVKIKELAQTIKEGSLLTVIKSTPSFGYENPHALVKELLELISDYKEPDPIVDVPPKRKTRRTLKKEDTIE